MMFFILVLSSFPIISQAEGEKLQCEISTASSGPPFQYCTILDSSGFLTDTVLQNCILVNGSEIMCGTENKGPLNSHEFISNHVSFDDCNYYDGQWKCSRGDDVYCNGQRIPSDKKHSSCSEITKEDYARSAAEADSQADATLHEEAGVSKDREVAATVPSAGEAGPAKSSGAGTEDATAASSTECEFGQKKDNNNQCVKNDSYITEVRNLARVYAETKKWLMDEFVKLGSDTSSNNHPLPGGTGDDNGGPDDKVGADLADEKYLSRNKCLSEGSDCLMTREIFAKSDAGAKGVEIAKQRMMKFKGDSGSVSSVKYPSATFEQCVNVFGGPNQVQSRQTNDSGWFKTATLPASIGTLAAELNRSIESDNVKTMLTRYKKARNDLITKIDGHTGKTTKAQDLLTQLRKDQNHEVWMEYLKDRVKIGAADYLTTFLRACDAAFYLTSFEDPLVEEAEDKHTSGQGAYGVITCKNTSPLYTQDYEYCVNVANAYDVYTVMEVATEQGSQIAGQAVVMTGQAQAMQTASVNPTDPTLQLFELKKQAQASAYTATGKSVIQAAMGAYLGTVAKKFWTLEDFVNKCDQQLPRNSSFTGSLYKTIIGGAGKVKDCSTPDSCLPTEDSASSGTGLFLSPQHEKNAPVVLHELILKSWDFIKFAGAMSDINSGEFLFKKTYANSDRDKASSKESATSKEEATKSFTEKLNSDPSVATAVGAPTDGDGRVATSPDANTGDCSGLDSNDYSKYFCLQVMDYDHCSVAANDIVGAGTLAPNDHVRALASSMATQALAKTLVSGAAAAAYYVQASNIQKMIDNINEKMEGVDMGGIAADLLTIQQCQMNPSLPQCGGLGFTDGSVGFGNGFGSISLDAGSSSTMGTTSSNDAATSDDASASTDTGESLSGSGAFQSFAGTDADEAAAARAGIKDSSASGGGSGGGAGNSPGSPGGSGGGKSPGAAGGSGGSSFGKNLTGTFGFGAGSTWGGGTGKKTSTGLDDALKGNARTGSVLDYRGPAGIGDDSVDIWKRISKGYNKAVTNKRLLEYVDE